MPFPPKLDSKIRTQFKNLIDEGLELASQMKTENRQSRSQPAYLMGMRVLDLTGAEYHNQDVAFEAYRTQASSLVQLVLPKTERFQQITSDFRALKSRSSSVEFINGTLIGLQKDYDAGLLDDISEMIEAEIASDYMGQAMQLLGEGIAGQYDHVPAAVLAGAVLEDALRRLCQRQTPPIITEKPDGSPKTLDPLIADLQKANEFNKAKADMLRSWAKIRNYAAHGEFTEFKRTDVEALIIGVKSFIADYL
ncbi:MAG: hypothetical protein K8F91_19440 [Candidatus Obscuribacterales bacterium]|nr:hypothetical protein [Candidatus Obscuribacterales bacterium]